MSRPENIDSEQTIDIWRVRKLDCDGGRIGREWLAEFFLNKERAESRQRELIAESDRRNPKYLFKTEAENVERVLGYCNWQFMIMVALDNVKAK